MRRAAAAVDVVAVILFVSIGRASHDHGESVGGFLSTVWPFAVGLGIGWLCVSRWRPGSFRTGLVVCLSTVAVGMVLRLLAGQGTAAAFIVVALSFLGVLMIGGRLLLGQAKRRLA
jgi:hypothetical protein